MSEIAERLRAELAALPEAERAEFASFLLGTLDDREELSEAELDATLARRGEEIASGKVVFVPHEQVHSRLREKYS